MSKMLKTTLLFQMIISALLGLFLLVMPGRFLAMVGWAPIDPIVSRILGAALLAMSWGAWRVWQGSSPAEAKWWVEIQAGFALLAALGILRHLVEGGWPLMAWIVFGVFGLFAILWLAIIVRERNHSAGATHASHHVAG
jgi:hypothetical protein